MSTELLKLALYFVLLFGGSLAFVGGGVGAVVDSVRASWMTWTAWGALAGFGCGLIVAFVVTYMLSQLDWH
jgi:hypothetical protein